MGLVISFRFLTRFLSCAILIAWFSQVVASQNAEQLQTYFEDAVGLSAEQIAAIRNGKAVAKVLKSRTADEIFVFGAVYVKGSPESYVRLATDFARLRKLPEFLALGTFSNPPKAADLEGFEFDSEDVKSLKECRPGRCEVHMPAEAIEDFRNSMDWNAPDPETRLNLLLHRGALSGLEAYKSKGNAALGVYSDKQNSVDVGKQFEYMLSYVQILPRYVPKFHRYLLDYPNGKTPELDDRFYWAKVKFGLKPTLRVIQVVTFQGKSESEPVYAIAEKQLYSSHYFETALDLTFCIRDPEHPKKPGFYLVKTMGSEQAGLTGIKGGVVRKVAVGRTASSLEKSLDAIKGLLEQQPQPDS